jgi:hypothetical protein
MQSMRRDIGLKQGRWRVAAWIRLTGVSVRVVSVILFLSMTTGCGGIGPTSVNRDRFDYISAISESWKQQMLLNIVKMRYADNPVFLDVGQVISGYELEGTLTAGGGLGNKTAPAALGDFLNFGAGGRYLDRPTVTYSPLTGADFIKTMMTPFPPGSIMFLAESGWPVDILLLVSTQAINGLRNHQGGPQGHPVDPEFLEVIRLLKRIQAAGGVGFKLQREKESEESTILLFHRRHMTSETAQDVEAVKRLLRLNPEATDIRITYGADAQKDDEPPSIPALAIRFWPNSPRGWPFLRNTSRSTAHTDRRPRHRKEAQCCHRLPPFRAAPTGKRTPLHRSGIGTTGIGSTIGTFLPSEFFPL